MAKSTLEEIALFWMPVRTPFLSGLLPDCKKTSRKSDSSADGYIQNLSQGFPSHFFYQLFTTFLPDEF